jgi:hypothetical protein
MALTDRQKETIQSSLQSKIRGNCPMCNSSNWSLENQVVATTATSLGGGMAMGGPYIPMVQLVCTNCGFVSHHAVGALGINLKEE